MSAQAYVHGTCRKCGCVVHFEVNGRTPDELREQLRQTQGYECPGRHVELGPMLDGFEMDWTPVEREEPLSNEEFARTLVVKYGRERVFHLGEDALGLELGLRSLHEVPGLEHMGFGEFLEPKTCRFYQRWDSPRGARFYVQQDI